MSGFRGKAENICADRVLLSLTQSGQSNLNHWLPLSDSAYTQPALGVIHAMSAPTASLRMAIGQIEFTMRWGSPAD
jgi:hypothetical protein